MEKVVERVFRFIEMIGITALIKAVIVPAYPVSGNITVGLLIAGATGYLVAPAYDWCIEKMTAEAKSKQPIVVAVLVTGALFLIVQIMWLQPLVGTVSDLIKATIDAPTATTKKPR